jgi:hypothetical protein
MVCREQDYDKGQGHCGGLNLSFLGYINIEGGGRVRSETSVFMEGF